MKQISPSLRISLWAQMIALVISPFVLAVVLSTTLGPFKAILVSFLVPVLCLSTFLSLIAAKNDDPTDDLDEDPGDPSLRSSIGDPISIVGPSFPDIDRKTKSLDRVSAPTSTQLSDQPHFVPRRPAMSGPWVDPAGGRSESFRVKAKDPLGPQTPNTG